MIKYKKKLYKEKKNRLDVHDSVTSKFILLIEKTIVNVQGIQELHRNEC